MGGGRGFRGIQYGRGQISLTTTRFIFADRRDRISQSWNEEGFSSLDQALFMCEIVDPSTLRSKQVVCEADIYKNDRDNRKGGCEGQIGGPCPVKLIIAVS